MPGQPSMILAALLLAGTPTPGPGDLADDDRAACFAVLERALAGEPRIVRVHAAEALVALGRPGPALAAFRPEAGTATPVDRILSWRVLAAAEPDGAAREGYLARIRAALLDPAGPDRTHALESLAKLKAPAASDAERDCVRSIADAAGPDAPFALWRQADAGEPAAIDRLAGLLRSGDPVARFRAAYVLGRLRPTHPAAAASLRDALARVPADAPERAILRAAAGADSARGLLADAGASPADRRFAAFFLAESGTLDDGPGLAALLREPDGDLRVYGAYARLRIAARRGEPTVPAPR